MLKALEHDKCPDIEGTVTKNGQYVMRCSANDSNTWLKELVETKSLKPGERARCNACHLADVQVVMMMKVWLKAL